MPGAFPKLDVMKHVFGRPNHGDAFAEVVKEMLRSKKASKSKNPREEIARIVESILKADAEKEKNDLKTKH